VYLLAWFGPRLGSSKGEMPVDLFRNASNAVHVIELSEPTNRLPVA
jgi:hypothetical protein